MEREELAKMLAPTALAVSELAGGEQAGRGGKPKDVQSTVAFQQLGVLALISDSSWGGMWASVAAQTLVERAGSSARALAQGARQALSFSTEVASATVESFHFVGRQTSRAAQAVGESSGKFRDVLSRSRELQREAQQQQRAERAQQQATQLAVQVPVVPPPPRAQAAQPEVATASEQRRKATAGGLASTLYRR
ncbi:hypothetical protein T492DRAFT_840220 [Pavlovales sp. CCMP2436]|nr:hypothetical protein T492DRAFT_840220 [Pavlovales sp. CCMP2436]